MANKFNLTPEVKEALRKANVSEEKIAAFEAQDSDIEKLSVDDLDVVSGGGDDGVLFCGKVTPEKDVYDLAMAMVDAYGYDAASAMFCDLTGLNKNEANDVHHGGISDRDNMSLLVNRLFKIHENCQQNNGKSF